MCGVALIPSGAFIAFARIKHGVDNLINEEYSNVKAGKWYIYLIKDLIPIQATILLVWWLISFISSESEWWNPFHITYVVTCLFQWGIVLLIFVIFNKKIQNLLFQNK